MKKVLILSIGGIRWAGVQVFLLNMLSNIDTHDFDIEWCCAGNVTASDLNEKFKQLGVSITPLNMVGASYHDRVKTLHAVMKNRSYDIIHINTGSMMFQTAALLLARWHRIPKRISHSHNALVNAKGLKGVFHRFCRWIIVHTATEYLACSKKAGEWLFGDKMMASGKCIVINNGINAKKYEYSPEIRLACRKRMGLEENFVIGHVGNFLKRKNHEFLLHIFEAVHKQNQSARLLLIGIGELQHTVRQQARAAGLEDRVIFAGATDKVHEFMQAMDVFVFPSLQEGLGIVGIEAQAAGLPCFFADTIPPEVGISEHVQFLSLRTTPEEWANRILKYADGYERRTAYDEIVSQGYDIENAAKMLEEVYMRRQDGKKRPRRNPLLST